MKWIDTTMEVDRILDKCKVIHLDLNEQTVMVRKTWRLCTLVIKLSQVQNKLRAEDYWLSYLEHLNKRG